MTEPTACGWCGATVYDWKEDGTAHKWGACIDLIEAWRRERDHLAGRRIYGRQDARLRELDELLAGIRA